MRAICYGRNGDSSVLRLVERPLPDPAEGEVRVRVAVSGVNPSDWKMRSRSPVSTLTVPHQDGAGLVDAVGVGVRDFRVGDRVWLWDVAWASANGTAQEYVTLPAAHAVQLPEAESFDTGASLGVPALTAHLALTASDAGPVQLAPGEFRGRTVLVTGGAGAVGHAAIQLAAWAGARVVTTVSSESKAALARRAGAHHVVNYRTQDLAAALEAQSVGGVDLVVDVDVAANIQHGLAVLTAGGTIASYAYSAEQALSFPVSAAMVKNLRLAFILTYDSSPVAKQRAIAGVGRALADGALRVGAEHGLPIRRFPLEMSADAHDAVENGFVGKVLIDVA